MSDEHTVVKHDPMAGALLAFRVQAMAWERLAPYMAVDPPKKRPLWRRLLCRH